VVFEAGHTITSKQNLAGTWPLVAILAAATSLAPWTAGFGAFVVATGRVAGALANGESWPRGSRIVSFGATAAFYTVAGVVWALLTRRLRVVETEVAARRARDDVARTLHDGVLQTLALVERRTAATDPELAATARASDRELRAWLYGGRSEERQGFDAALRHAADRVAAGYDLPVTVNLVAEREPDDEVAAAIVGAVGEALANAAKHAEASKVVVYAEVDERGAVFASVRDDGRGMDADAARSAGRGIVRSIDERMAAVGGRAELVSSAERGTEVRLWA
jgi:signal transduction histidine kinase